MKYQLLFILLAIAVIWCPAIASETTLPADVSEFLERRTMCGHFRGEEPYDDERAEFLSQRILETCTGTDKALRDLKLVHQDNDTVMAVLAPFEESIESRSEERRLRCEPDADALSFRFYADKVRRNDRDELIGFGHSFAVTGEMQVPEECRTPWYEKYILRLTMDGNTFRHTHEYMDGCYLHLQLPISNGDAYLWTDVSADSEPPATKIAANCTVQVVVNRNRAVTVD